ncbi:hypothetical protein PRIPAC_75082, partial [Pristionchus pacificus]
GGNVVLECTAPIVVEETSRIEDDTKAEETEDEVEEEPARKVMGMTEESAIHAELASATVPKERKFQVVRVPGVFTRGRWKCWDYRDDVKPIEGLTFTDDKENDSAGTVPVAPSTSVSTTVSEPANNSSLREESSTIVVTSIAPAPPTPQHGTPDKSQVVPTTVTITSTQPQQPVTDTVVVQSIAPPATQEQQPIVVVVPAPPPIPPSPSLSTTVVDVPPPTAPPPQQPQQTTSSIVVVEEPPPRRELQQQPPSGESMTVSMTSSETGGTPSIGGVSTVSIGSGGGGAPPSLSSSVSPPFVPTATPSPEMTRSGSEAAAPATPAAAAAATAAQVDEEPAASVPAMSNAAAIDNKIEQAMDLVKTHLTFAVREEVEILRTTIAELESRVTTLETQNTYLKRHVTPEVMSNLPGMVHQHKMSLPATAQPVMPLQQVPAATSAPSTTVSPSLAAAVLHEQQQQAVLEAAAAAAATISPPRAAAAPPPSPAAAAAATTSPSKPYCPATTNFVNSLNTVVNSPPNPR